MIYEKKKKKEKEKTTGKKGLVMWLLGVCLSH